jgi:hypothetical protein
MRPSIRPALALALAGVLCALPNAGGAADLHDLFVGRRVVVRIAMPATDRGVELHDGETPPVRDADYRERLRKGIALLPGDTVLVTGLHFVRGALHLELAGGGHGLKDVVIVTPRQPGGVGRYVKVETHSNDPAIERQYEHMRQEERDRRISAENARLLGEAGRPKPKRGGSRFVILFPAGGADTLSTPAHLHELLGAYLEFPPAEFPEFAPAPDTSAGPRH